MNLRTLAILSFANCALIACSKVGFNSESGVAGSAVQSSNGGSGQLTQPGTNNGNGNLNQPGSGNNGNGNIPQVGQGPGSPGNGNVPQPGTGNSGNGNIPQVGQMPGSPGNGAFPQPGTGNNGNGNFPQVGQMPGSPGNGAFPQPGTGNSGNGNFPQVGQGPGSPGNGAFPQPGTGNNGNGNFPQVGGDPSNPGLGNLPQIGQPLPGSGNLPQPNSGNNGNGNFPQIGKVPAGPGVGNLPQPGTFNPGSGNLPQIGMLNPGSGNLPTGGANPGSGNLPTTGNNPGSGNLPTGGVNPGSGNLPTIGNNPGSGNLPTGGVNPGSGNLPSMGNNPGNGNLCTTTTSTNITVNPRKVCSPPVGAASQSFLKTTTNISAVLYKMNGTLNSPFQQGTVVQAWDSAADQTAIQAQLTNFTAFQLSLAQPLTAGTYSIVFYDSSKAKAPYTYNANSTQDAVAPIMDTVAGMLDSNALIKVDASGNGSFCGQLNVVYTTYDDTASCSGAGQIDPLAIDLGDGSGVSLSSQANGVSIDLEANGKTEKVSWMTQPDLVGFLVNTSSSFTHISGQELFGNYTKGPDGKTANNGYEALRKFDLNKDGVINSSDAIWPKLKIWLDHNRNGVVDPGELISLDQAHVLSIVLPTDTSTGRIYKERCQTDAYGNQVCHGRGAHVTFDDGSGGTTNKSLVDIDFKSTSP